MVAESKMAAKDGRTGKSYQADGHPPEASGQQKEPPSPPKGGAAPDTYRVRGIPRSVGVENLKKTLLKELFGSESSAEVAGEPTMIQYEYPGADTQTALIRFSEKPEAFKDQAQYPLNSWRGAVIDREFFGFTTLYEGQRDQPVAADIIAVTGLSAHAYGSWRAKGAHKGMWLRDFLPEKVPNCRIMTHGYDSDVKKDGFNTLDDYANEFLEQLELYRQGTSSKGAERPIIFIGHSLGGLVVTHSIVKSHKMHGRSGSDLLSLTKAIIFFGTPHRGLKEHAENILQAVGEELGRADLVKSLRVGTPALEDGFNEFLKLLRPNWPSVATYYEQKRTVALQKDESGRHLRPEGGRKYVALEPNDTRLGVRWERCIPVDKDHSTIVKFDTACDRTFEHVYQFIRKVTVSDADKKTCSTVACAIGHENIGKLRELYKAKAPKRVNSGQSMPYLHQAVKCNTTEVLGTLIDLGANLSEKDENGNTALHLAILEGREDMVDILFQHTNREDIWVRGQNQATPLDFALQSEAGSGYQLVHRIFEFAFSATCGVAGSVEIERAITKGRDALNYTSYKDGSSPVLHRAVLAGDVEVVKAILSKGAKVDLKESVVGRTALHAAVWSRDLENPEEMAKVLIDAGATVDARDNNGQTPLSTAVWVGNTRVATALLAHGADTGTILTHGLVVLHVACYLGRLDLVEILLARGVDVNALCTSGNDALVQVALGHLENNLYPVDPEISLADIFGDYTQIARLLLERGANALTQNLSNRTALHIFLENVSSFLIKRIGCQLNEVEGSDDDSDDENDGEDDDDDDDDDDDEDDEEVGDEEGEDEDADIEEASLKTYHSEMKTGFLFYAGIARLLLNKGADINTKDEGWKTLLHILSQGPFKFILTVGDLALHPKILEPVFQGYTDLIEMVLGRKGDVNAKDDTGKTPLDYVHESRDKLKKEFPEDELSIRVEGAAAKFTEMAKVLKSANGRNGSTGYQQQSAAKPGKKTQQTPSKAVTPKAGTSRQAGSNAPVKSGPYYVNEKISTLLTSASGGTRPGCNCIDCARMRNGGPANKKAVPSTMKRSSQKSGPVSKGQSDEDDSDSDDDELLNAVTAGDLETVRRLLQNEDVVSGLDEPKNRDPSGSTLLHIAVEKGYENIARTLLRNGCSVTPKTASGETALHIAIGKKSRVFVRMLLFEGWKRDKPKLLALNYKNSEGDTALHLAVDSGDKEILEMVLNRKPNLEMLGSKGRTALCLAVYGKNEAAVESLLARGAKLKQDLPRRETLLHAVARLGNRVNIGRILLKYDSDNDLLNAMDSRKRSPLDVAIEFDKPQTIKFLKDQGGI